MVLLLVWMTSVFATPQYWRVSRVKVMNFYRPVPCVSAPSFSLRGALTLKDNYGRQFVLRGLAK